MTIEGDFEVPFDEARAPRIDSLECIETGSARLYLSATEVFKTRKPVRVTLGDATIDLRSTDARRAVCLEEERLGQSLAPDVFGGLVAVVADRGGHLRFGGQGAPTDWAIRMRRLRDADRADRRLHAGTLEDAHLIAVAHRLAAFHERHRGGAGGSDPLVDGRQHEEGVASSDLLDRMRGQIELRIGRVAQPDALAFEAIESWQKTFLHENAERFLRRARGGELRQGHGELSLEHVFIDGEGRVQILPGYEIGPRVAPLDVTADVALFATDLAVRHRVDLAERFVAEYARLANDFDLYPLLDFHASLCASTRAKVDAFSAEYLAVDTAMARRDRTRSRRFAMLARAASRRPLLPPVVVAMGGQVASGKSTVGRHIAHRIGAPVVGSDPARDFLLGARLNAELHEMRWDEAYEAGFGERVYAEVLRRAGEVLASGRPVVIDGCFRSRAQRRRALELAERFELPFLFVEAAVSREVQTQRLAERAERDRVPLSDWQAIADDMRAQWEPATELDAAQRLVLDTARPLEQSSDAIEACLPTWPEALTG